MPRATKAAASPPGSGRGVNGRPWPAPRCGRGGRCASRRGRRPRPAGTSAAPVTSRWGSTRRLDSARRGSGSRSAGAPGRGQAAAIECQRRRRRHLGHALGRAAPAGRRLHAPAAGPQPGRQHLFELGQRPGRGLLDAGQPAEAVRSETATATASSSSSRSGRQVGPGPQPVAARGARHRVDRVAELRGGGRRRAGRSARRPRAGRRARRRPVAPRLEDRQEPQQPGGGLEHGTSLPDIEARSCPRPVTPPVGDTLRRVVSTSGQSVRRWGA